jgi:hypothetical protein
MKPNAHVNSPLNRTRLGTLVALVSIVSITCLPVAVHAQTKKKNPSSKVFVTDVSGEAVIDTGSNVQDLSKQSVYNAEGTIIETKKARNESEKNKVFSTGVFSNGTAAYFDEDTKVELRNFVQEPFTPNRSDMDVEPSISKTLAFVQRGTVGLCASKLVAGSSMNYSTSLGSVNIRGQKIVIQSDDKETKVSMLDGESTVRGGDQDLGGEQLKSGQQAIIRPGKNGGKNTVTIQPIPDAEKPSLDDKVAMACMAKKTVYFEVREIQTTNVGAAGGNGPTGSGSASGGSTDGAGGGGSEITAFNGPGANTASGSSSGTVQEIVAVPVVPSNLPVQFTVSPARIVTPPAPGG